MSYPIEPEFWSNNKGIPKYKFKFLVEFDTNSIISQTFTQKQYMYLIKSITRPKATIGTLDASDQETRNWFGNSPDPTKRLQGPVSWSPITIKFVNQISRVLKKGSTGNVADGTYQPPDDENAPDIMATPDLDHFFSRILEDMDSSMFGGSAPKEFDFPTGEIYSKEQDVVAAYLNSLSSDLRIEAAKQSFGQNFEDAKTAGFKLIGVGEPQTYSTSNLKASTMDKSNNCKSSMDSFMRASCVFFNFFGDIKIYDLATNIPTEASLKYKKENEPNDLDNVRASQTIKNGYWTLRNPYIKGIDFGNHDYFADDFVEYSVEIGYESARYVVLDYVP